MSSSESERDLGVIVQSNLKWEEHIREINQVLGLISRAYVNKSQQNIMPLYKSLVRPHLEYAVQAWRPYTPNDVERVQRRATTMIKGLGSDSYQERLNKTGLIYLEMRRLRVDSIFLN